jgi:hypothetical protein
MKEARAVHARVFFVFRRRSSSANGPGGWNQKPRSELDREQPYSGTAMKPLVICAAVVGLALSSAAADAKGCIKGAIIGGVAGHYAGHGKVGVVAGCIIGRHEANKAAANRADRRTPPPSSSQDGRI